MARAKQCDRCDDFIKEGDTAYLVDLKEREIHPIGDRMYYHDNGVDPAEGKVLDDLCKSCKELHDEFMDGAELERNFDAIVEINGEEFEVDAIDYSPPDMSVKSLYPDPELSSSLTWAAELTPKDPSYEYMRNPHTRNY